MIFHSQNLPTDQTIKGHTLNQTQEALCIDQSVKKKENEISVTLEYILVMQSIVSVLLTIKLTQHMTSNFDL